MRRFLTNRLVLAVLVLMAAGAEFGLAWVSHPVALAGGVHGAAPSRAAVTSVTRACPAPGSAGATAGGLALATVPAAPGQTGRTGRASGPSGTGQVLVTRLSPAGTITPGAPVHSYTRPGQLTLARVPVASVLNGHSGGNAATASGSVPTSPARGGVLVQATGAMARGLEVEQTGPGQVTTAQCTGPGTDFWFVGPGQHSVGHIELYLMNPDSAPADVSVTVITDSGPLLGSTDTGIAVPPHGMVVQSLDRLLRRSRVVALHVSTNVGRVVAALRETKSAADPGAWLPVAQPPATSQVLPGLPSAPGGRELYVAVPGAANAQVKVTAVTGKGSYLPTGGSGIDLPGGSAVGIPLPSLGGVPAAVRLTSNVPVTAVMTLAGGAAGAPGVFTAASGPIQQQGVIAANLARPAGSAELILSAPKASAQVSIAAETTGGSSGSAGPSGTATRTVSIAAGHSVVVRLRSPPGAAAAAPFAVVITPAAGSGPVYAGRVLSVGSVVQSILPVTSSLSWVSLPQADSSLLAALP